jgi:hypothetical protein
MKKLLTQDIFDRREGKFSFYPKKWTGAKYLFLKKRTAYKIILENYS